MTTKPAHSERRSSLSPSRTESLRALREIPGVGPSIAADLVELGIRRVTDLRGKDPERMYLRFCAKRGQPIDRCLLYVFRCAVYYAETPRPSPDLLKWWSWKDRTLPRRRRKP